MKRKHIKYLLFFSLCFILFSQKTFAINTCAEGWKVDVGSNNKKTIDCHGICKIVTNNNCSASVFVPTKTSTEWSEFLTHFPSCVSVTDCCTNECSYSGQTEYRCSGSWVQYRTCGNYDSDPCLEWSSWSNYENCDSYDGCSGGYYYNYYCSNGYCAYSSSCTESCCDEYYGDSRAYCSGGYCYGPPSCTNECSYSGQTECCDSWSYRTCGNYDSDSCLEWSSCTSCPSGQTCSGGVCSGSTPPPSSQPDLVITDVWLDSSGYVNYTLKNQGSVSAGSSHTSVWCKSSNCNWLVPILESGLVAGESRSKKYDGWQCLSGESYTFEITADTYDEVSESNETNNALVRTLGCGGGGAKCGNGIVESGEQCEYPNTTNNTYCSQTTSQCDYTNRRYCTRDSYGNCNSSCKCVEDSWNCSSTDDSNYCNNCTHCGDGICNCGETSSTCSKDCGPAPSCSASLSCQSSTENSITLSYSFSNCGAMYLYRGSTNLKNLGSGTQSGTYTDSNLSPGTSYTYYLKEGNTTKATQTCSTSAIEPKLPNCSFSGNSGIWAGMKDVAWSDSGCYICNSPNECGTCCGYCRSQLSGSYRFIYKKNWLGFRENDLRTSGGPTFVASDGWDANKTTKLCKIGNTPNISICPFSGGEKGRFYVTNEYAIQYAKIDLSNKSNWIPILYPECGSWQNFKVGGQDYHFSQCPNPDYDNCNYYVETYGCFGSDASLARCWFNWWEWPLGGSNIPSPCRICYVP